MWSIIKSEIIYFKRFLAITYILPIIYMLMMVIGFDYNKPWEIFYRIFGTLIFGMLPVIVIAMAFSSSIKERRTRLFGLLPLELKTIAFSRLIYFIIPLIYLNIVGIFSILLSDNGWQLISSKVVYQFGAIYVLLSALYIGYEFLMMFEVRSDMLKIALGGIFIAIVIILLFQVDNILWDKVPQAYIGWLYSSASILILLTGRHLFLSRKTYLD